MTATPPSSRHERLQHWLAELEHILPAQAPIRDFVHHNTLHGFQHLPFADALAAAQAVTGARCYWPSARFREAYAGGRIGRDDLLAALADAGIDDLEAPLWGGLRRRDVWLAALLVDETAPSDAARLATCRQLLPALPPDWRECASRRWAALAAGVGRQHSLRGLLARLSGEDVLASVRGILQRHLAAHLDLGMAAWRNPDHGEGFYAAWKASAGRDLAWELDELPDIRDEIQHLPDDAVVLLEAELRELQPDETGWYELLQRLALEMPGWSGMFLRRDRHPLADAGTPVTMADYLAVRVFLERRLCSELLRRLTGSPGGLAELDAYCRAHPAEFLVRDARHLACLSEDLLAAAGRLCAVPPVDDAAWEALAPAVAAHLADDRAAADARILAGLLEQLAEAAPSGLDEAGARALLGELARLTPELRGQLWLEAYEGHYREQLFGALAANAGRRQTVVTPSAQVVMCMDDREEGTRRHLEEVAPDIETFGAAGFFGLPMYWQGLDDAQPLALCPVVVTPDRLVREQALPGSEAAARHARRRERRLRWRERLYQDTRRAPLAGPLLTAAAGLPALAALTATTLAPAWLARALRRWREQFDGRVAGEPVLTRAASDDPGRLPVFSDEEQIERVEDFLRAIGLTDGFAPLVLMFGHGSGSLNNPHLSAYDCGACSGRHGGPNARVFAAMANRPEVRAGLAGRGIVIPAGCHFVAAEHHTGDDSIEWYDLDRLPASHQADFDRLLAKLSEASRWHAVERCRRPGRRRHRPRILFFHRRQRGLGLRLQGHPQPDRLVRGHGRRRVRPAHRPALADGRNPRADAPARRRRTETRSAVRYRRPSAGLAGTGRQCLDPCRRARPGERRAAPLLSAPRLAALGGEPRAAAGGAFARLVRRRIRAAGTGHAAGRRDMILETAVDRLLFWCSRINADLCACDTTHPRFQG